MIHTTRLVSLQGVGDRWEQEVRQRFGREQSTFVPPDSYEAAQARSLVQEVSQTVSRQDVARLDSLEGQAEKLGLGLSRIKTDHDEFLLLQELQPTRGWGHVLFRVPSESSNGQAPRPGSYPSLIIEVPHPAFDGGTPELGVEVFEKTRADVLLVAGAHRLNRSEPSLEQPERRLADPAHSSATFFHAAHLGLQGPGQAVVQLHGFSARSPDDPQVVLSDGQDDAYDPPGLVSLNQGLRRQGLKTRVVDFQEDWLTARSNLQGQAMASQHLLGPEGPSQFIHLELDPSLRKGPEREQGFDKILRALEGWNPGVPPVGAE